MMADITGSKLGRNICSLPVEIIERLCHLLNNVGNLKEVLYLRQTCRKMNSTVSNSGLKMSASLVIYGPITQVSPVFRTFEPRIHFMIFKTNWKITSLRLYNCYKGETMQAHDFKYAARTQCFKAFSSDECEERFDYLIHKMASLSNGQNVRVICNSLGKYRSFAIFSKVIAAFRNQATKIAICLNNVADEFDFRQMEYFDDIHSLAFARGFVPTYATIIVLPKNLKILKVDLSPSWSLVMENLMFENVEVFQQLEELYISDNRFNFPCLLAELQFKRLRRLEVENFCILPQFCYSFPKLKHFKCFDSFDQSWRMLCFDHFNEYWKIQPLGHSNESDMFLTSDSCVSLNTDASLLVRYRISSNLKSLSLWLNVDDISYVFIRKGRSCLKQIGYLNLKVLIFNIRTEPGRRSPYGCNVRGELQFLSENLQQAADLNSLQVFCVNFLDSQNISQSVSLLSETVEFATFRVSSNNLKLFRFGHKYLKKCISLDESLMNHLVYLQYELGWQIWHPERNDETK